ncbi:hypothetical protein CCR83_00115 [Rhodobacter veldkampii DSM 11550]|nr:hypothetical protein [Phaeovulum veldkampii DSM 11550]
MRALSSSLMSAFDEGFEMQRWQHFRCLGEHCLEGRPIGRLRGCARMWQQPKAARRSKILRKGFVRGGKDLKQAIEAFSSTGLGPFDNPHL